MPPVAPHAVVLLIYQMDSVNPHVQLAHSVTLSPINVLLVILNVELASEALLIALVADLLSS